VHRSKLEVDVCRSIQSVVRRGYLLPIGERKRCRKNRHLHPPTDWCMMLAPVRMNEEWISAHGLSFAEVERTASALLEEDHWTSGIRSCGSQSVFAKLYQAHSVSDRLRQQFRTGSAVVAFDVSRRLGDIGIRCPAPICVLRCRRSARTVFLSEALSDGDILQSWLSALCGATPPHGILQQHEYRAVKIDVLLNECAVFLTRIHAAGVYHSDLHDKNIWLEADQKGQLTFALLDVEAIRFYRNVSERRCQKNLIRLARNIGTDAARGGIDGNEFALQLVEEYYRLAGRSISDELRSAIRESVLRGIERWTEICRRNCG
jgi:hypothetical protein